MKEKATTFFYDYLRNSCPNLYRHGIGFECNTGWLQLLTDLSFKLEKLILEQPKPKDFFATQVKEKYGTLRFYMSIYSDEMEKLIEEAEDESAKTCEICGKPGELRYDGWYRVQCDKCYDNHSW